MKIFTNLKKTSKILKKTLWLILFLYFLYKINYFFNCNKKKQQS